MKTAVFSFGRFNPPTIGHEKLIKKVESIAEQNKADFYIYPSWSQSPDKDPLPHKVKFEYMKKAFPKYAKNIISNSKCKSAIHVLTKLYDAGYERVLMVVGSDRIAEFDRLLNKYNGKKAVHGFYDFSDGVEIVSAGERDPDAQGVEGMSASKMRKAAAEGDFDSFKTGISNMSDSDKRKMFDDLRKWMNVNEEVYERKLTSDEKSKLEKYVLKLKKKTAEFKKNYGDQWKQVMYAVATKLAKGESMKAEKRTFKSFKEFAQSLELVEDKANFEIIDDSDTLKQAKQLVKQVKSKGGIVWIDLSVDKPNVNQSSTKKDFESDVGGWDAVDSGKIFIVYNNL